MTEYYTQEGDKYIKVSEPLHTQEQLDKVLEKRLEKESKKYADYTTLKEQAAKAATISDEYEAKLQEANSKIDALKGDVKKGELNVERVKLLSEFKLNEDMAEFIVGDDVDEMRRRAEKLAVKQPSTLGLEKKSLPPAGDNAKREAVRKLFGTPDV